MDVILAAAGEGKRLYSESLEVPKPLVFYKTKPIISHLIDVYKFISKSIIVVVSGNFKGQLLSAWLKDYYENAPWLTIINQPIPNGTNDVVSRALPYVKSSEILVSWCDFILSESALYKIIKAKKQTFFTSNIDCRFGTENNVVVQKKSNPGFIGLYYLTKKPTLSPACDDFIENFLNQEVHTESINDIVNLGTINDLIENKAFVNDSNRYFNLIEFKENTVEKIAIDKQGVKLQEKEVNWYQNAPDTIKSYLPKYEFKNNRLILERINGKPISSCKLDKTFWRIKLPELLSNLHQPVNFTDESSCIDTYITKPKSRIKEVNNIIEKWFNGNYIINGVDFKDFNFDSLIPKDLIPKNFTFIHGDLQFSNSMMDINGDLKILDPRGYFGSTINFGDPAYDIAKLLYATDAYHKINEGNFGLYKGNNGDTTLIHETNFPTNEDMRWFFDWACERYEISKEKLNFVLFGIWLSLTAYAKNKPLAIIAAYAKAMIRSKSWVY